MKPDDVISYHDLVGEEKAALQRGMNYRVGKNYSVFLMSIRPGAPYVDQFDEATGTLLYEGHDEKRSPECQVPKNVDQPLTTPQGAWTENGKFYQAAKNFRSGMSDQPELIKVYEKISKGIWSYKGFFELVDADIVSNGQRRVFKFHLRPVEKKVFNRRVELPHNRLIPTEVKLKVWQRDQGRCVLCGATTNLHYDHEIPFSRGGTSLSEANVRLLCAKHNLQKSDHIMGLLPWIVAGASVGNDLARRL